MANQHIRKRTADTELGPISPMTTPSPLRRPSLRADDPATVSPKNQNSDQDGSHTASTSAAVMASALVLLYLSPMLGLIFGGCCSNVYALEAIIKIEPDSGTLISFTQFCLVAAIGYYANFTASHPPFFLKPTQVPLGRIFKSTALFWSVNTLNNYAFGFQISVPVHIILRSGGSVTTMVFGYIWGKRYSRAQVFSVALLTAGVVLSAWADADAKGKTHKSSPQTLYSFGTGLAILFLAQLLSAWMGLYVEATYQKYGNHWRENFFYSHLLSLPLFTPFLPTLWKQLRKLAASPPLIPSSQLYDIIPYSLSKMILSVPSQILFLGINSITQYACIRGVSLLASQSTALTVTIVLNVRKLASLLLSIWLFENKLAPGIVVGAGIVFGSGALYGWESQRIRKRAQAAGKANGALLEATVEKRS